MPPSDSPWYLEAQSPGGLFVLGAPRSGTSAMAWAIAQHDAFNAGPEIDLPFYLARERTGMPSFQQALSRDDGWLAVHGVEAKEFQAAIGTGIHQMLSAHVGGTRWIDSTPASVLQWATLADMFPTACFVHMLRDGRKVVASLLRSGFDTAAAKDFKTACKTWEEFARRGREMVESMPGRAIEVLQADMESDPSTATQAIFQVCGEDHDERAADFLRKGRINSSYGNEKEGDVRKLKPLDTTPRKPWSDWGSGQKKNFVAIAGETMERLGFGTDLF